MQESIKLMQARVEIFDRLNNSMNAMNAAENDVDAARTGMATRGQMLDGMPIDVRTLDMNAEQVMRDDRAFAKMSDAIDALGSDVLSKGFKQCKQDLDDLNKLQKNFLEGGLQEI